MWDMIAMYILHSIYYLFEVEFCLLLSNLLALDIIEKFSIIGQLHNNKDIICSVQDLVKFYNIRMVYKLQDTDLSLNLRNHILIFHIFLIDDLDCNFDVSQVMLSHYNRNTDTFNSSETAVTDSFTQDVMSYFNLAACH